MPCLFVPAITSCTTEKMWRLWEMNEIQISEYKPWNSTDNENAAYDICRDNRLVDFRTEKRIIELIHCLQKDNQESSSWLLHSIPCRCTVRRAPAEVLQGDPLLFVVLFIA